MALSSTKSGFWPEYYYEWDDLLAQQTADKVTIEEDAKTRNQARVRPSAQEISRMETAICWAGHYISSTEIARIVQHVALARSRNLDMRYVSRRMKLGSEHVREKNDLGLNIITLGLICNQVRVF
jgi:hypothetical protein